MTIVRFGGAQTQGARNYQEDAWRVEKAPGGGLLAVLADGMGGHAGGAVAAQTAIEAFTTEFLESTRPAGISAETLLQRSLSSANHAIRLKSEADASLDGMGCTLVGLHVDAKAIHWISVGDSPFWMLRKDELVRLNADHSMKAVFDRLVEMGEMTPDEAATDRRRNVLRSAVSGDDISMVDHGGVPLEAGAVLVLASDGAESLDLSTLADLVMGREPDDAAQSIINAVDELKKPHQDNATVIVMSASNAAKV